jgi:hypothetical protein
MKSRAEGHFFDREGTVQGWLSSHSRYHRSFKTSGREHVLGENTPIYIYWYDAPRRIWKYNPRMKFIVLLRNPIERAYSHWNMERTRGRDVVDFWTALQTERERCREALPFQHRVFSYTDRGFYTEQLRRLWHFFPREQTLILKSEDLKARPEATLEQVCRFLSLEPLASVVPLIAGSQEYLTPMSTRERHFLEGLFQREITRLEHLLDWDCSNWRNGVDL